MQFAQNTLSLLRQKDNHSSFLATINIKHFYIMKKFLFALALLGGCCSGFANPNDDDDDDGGNYHSSVIIGKEPKRIEINGPIRLIYEDGYLRFMFDTNLGFVTCSVQNANYNQTWVTTMNSYLEEGDMYIGKKSGEYMISIVTEDGVVFNSSCTLIHNYSDDE